MTDVGSKAVAATVLGIVVGSMIHRDYATWGTRGREAFLAYQAHRFDTYMVAPLRGSAGIVGGLLLVLVFCAVYEAIVAVLSAITRSRASERPAA